MKKLDWVLGIILALLTANLLVNIAILHQLQKGTYRSAVDVAVEKKANTTLPRLIKRVQPEYPEEARKNKWEGEVFLRTLVDTNGKVVDVKLIRSSGYPCLDSSAIEAIRKFEFEPAVENGEKKAAYITIPFTFKLRK